MLDGEVLALRADGRPEAFQVIASRTASSTDVAAVSTRTPIRAFFFDLLHVDGRDLLDAPLTARAEAMSVLLPSALMVPRRIVANESELAAAFAAAVADGYEGLVVKRPSAPYAAGRREASWIKIKPRHTFDLVVTAVEWGSGRRQGWLSNLHLAARDADSGDLVMLGKTFKGLTDELLRWQTQHFLALEERRDPIRFTSGPPRWSKSPATACRCHGAIPVGWRCGSRGCCVTARTKQSSRPTPSRRSDPCWARRRGPSRAHRRARATIRPLTTLTADQSS